MGLLIEKSSFSASQRLPPPTNPAEINTIKRYRQFITIKKTPIRATVDNYFLRKYTVPTIPARKPKGQTKIAIRKKITPKISVK